MFAAVLLVDDVQINRTLIRRTLEVAGAAVVVEAADGQAAYEIYKNSGGAFSLVLMDCRMPVMDGWQATEHIRLLERAAGWPPVPIVACTTEDVSPGSPTLERCWACGMTAATGKPLSKQAAAQLLNRWAGAGAAPEPCRSSDGGSTRELLAAPSMSSAASDAAASQDTRTSLDSETGCLPFRLRRQLAHMSCMQA
ncbi:hypothetical protein ABPG77_003325 [Micractinium sp. CCAP 211/92]